MGKYLKACCAVLIIGSQLATPFAFAQELPVSNGDTGAGSPSLFDSGSQAQVYSQGIQPGSSNTSGDAGDFAADAVGCSVGQIVGNIAQAGVSSVIGSIKGQVGSYVSTVTGRVPITNPEIENNTALLADKNTGGGSSNIATGIANAIAKGPSWDSIGFCLANATIQYLTQSTVNWINSGFEGNPTFVDNPEQFFQDIADIELEGFLEELGVGFMCSANAQAQIKLTLVNDLAGNNRNRMFGDRYRCSFDRLGTNLESFLDDFRNGGIDAFVEYVYNPASRPSSAYLAAREEANNRIIRRVGATQWELRTSDFLNFKNCEEVTVNGVKKQVNCRTYTPGQMIEAQVNAAIDSPRNRLEIADEFDEIVAALVNQLIRTALSETTSVDRPRNNSNDDNDDEDEDDNNGGFVGGQTGNPTTGGGQTGNVPTPNAAISGVCRVSTTTVAVDMPVQFTVVPQGGNRQYTFDWLGSPNFPTSTRSSSILVSFASTTDASDVNVRIRSAGKSAIVSCPDVRVTPAVPLQVSCEPDDTSVSVGETVTWMSEVSGGTGHYLYEWTGDISDFSKNSQNNTISYFEDGRYDASLKVTSGSQSKTVLCDGPVRVR